MSFSAFAVPAYTTDFSTLSQVSVKKPSPTGGDLFVRIHAVSTNPVDCKKLSNFGSFGDLERPLIVGWDASGVVEEVGSECSLFKKGDEVYFAGSLIRDGCFGEYAIVDERLVGKKPKTLSHLEAAVLPLTTLTAWEIMEHRMHIPRNSKGTILINGGAGGVGSITIQLAKKVFGLNVIATASRPETVEWCKSMGADHVISHKEPLAPQLQKIGINAVDWVVQTADLANDNLKEFVSVAKPFSAIGFITSHEPLDPSIIFAKCIRVVPEFMFSPSIHGVNMEVQGKILNEASALVDDGTLKTTLNKTFDWTLQGLQEALTFQSSGKAIGKIGLNVC